MAYQFDKSTVHVVRWTPGSMPRRLNCFRCHRDMPEDQFEPLRGSYFRPVRNASNQGTSYVHYLHPFCWTCRKQAHGKHVNHPLYAPLLDLYWSKRVSVMKTQSRTRGILCLLEKDDLLGKYLEQSGRCAITGLKMTCILQTSGRSKMQASCDRIDSDGNYTVDNIQIVCDAVNVMKQDLKQAEFVKFCRLVVEMRDSKDQMFLAAVGA